MRNYKIGLVTIIIFSTVACKKFVEVAPPANQLASKNIYNNNASAADVINGIYGVMQGDGYCFSGGSGIAMIGGLVSDELKNYSAANLETGLLYMNNLNSNDGIAIKYWQELYQVIYYANAAIDGLESVTGVSAGVKQQLIGEAKFIRAFCHFYLVNLYGAVPIAITSDYRVNNTLSRSPVDQVYAQIIADLKDAEGSLSPDFLSADIKTITTERTRPTKWAAAALLARVYLYTNDWQDAVTESSKLINETGRFQVLDDLNSVFLKNSQESIWQLESSSPGYNTKDGFHFILQAAPDGDHPAALSDNLLAAFEVGDKRKTEWIGRFEDYYYPYKYKVGTYGPPVTEYLTVFRLAEQYLIRAEAYAHLNKISEAQEDLNMIRKHHGKLPYTEAADSAALLSAILHERQVELFTEWGNRWFDLKRTGKVDEVMSVITPQKGGTWKTTDQLFPIPQIEIQANPNLTPNSGYN